ncbi:MAG: hypothetical protein RLO50_02685 [Azospirillaceae bacterium]
MIAQEGPPPFVDALLPGVEIASSLLGIVVERAGIVLDLLYASGLV